MRMLLLDRGVGNPHQLGLATELSSGSDTCLVGGPRAFEHPLMHGVFPRSLVRGHRLLKLLDVPPAVSTFSRLLRRYRPDVLHVQWPGTLEGHYARRGLRFGTALVYTVHEPGLEGRAGRSQGSMIDIAHRLIVLGPSIAESVVAAFPNVGHKIHVVELGNYEHVIRRHSLANARAQLGLAPDEPVFVFVGQLRRSKGLDTLLEAFALYRQRYGRGALLIAGLAVDEAYVSTLRALATRLRVPVTWYVSRDHVAQSDLDVIVSAASQVVLPFREASQSSSVIFAMTYGRCVVSTRVGEVTRTLTDRGVIVNPNDPVALSRAMGYLEDNPEAADRLAEAALRYTHDTLSWTRIARDTRAVYAAAIGELNTHLQTKGTQP